MYSKFDGERAKKKRSFNQNFPKFFFCQTGSFEFSGSAPSQIGLPKKKSARKKILKVRPSPRKTLDPPRYRNPFYTLAFLRHFLGKNSCLNFFRKLGAHLLI